MWPVHLDRFTLQRLELLLKQTKVDSSLDRIRKLLKSPTFFQKQETNHVCDILRYVHINSYLYEETLPKFLVDFLKMESSGKKAKLSLVERYSSVLTLSHSIKQLQDRDNDKLIRNYHRLWKEWQCEFHSNQYPYNRQNLAECDEDSLAQLRLHPNFHPDSNRIALIRNKLSSLDTKVKPPDLRLIIHPDRFGEPPVPERVFNMQLNRLIRLQQYLVKNRPVKLSTFEYLSQIDLTSLDGTVREAYVTFIREMFAITDNDFISSKLLESRLKMSAKVKELYRLANEKP
jgi:hypothetical protein